MFKRVLGFLLAAAVVATPSVGTSATAKGTLSVSASAIASCSIVNGTLPFGNVAATGSTTVVNATGTFSVICTNGSAYTLSMDKGANGSSISNREMKVTAGTATMSYQIYQDSGHTIVFGDGTTGSTLAGTGNGLAQVITVYGQIPSQNVGTTGLYTDTVNITVTY